MGPTLHGDFSPAGPHPRSGFCGRVPRLLSKAGRETIGRPLTGRLLPRVCPVQLARVRRPARFPSGCGFSAQVGCVMQALTAGRRPMLIRELYSDWGARRAKGNSHGREPVEGGVPVGLSPRRGRLTGAPRHHSPAARALDPLAARVHGLAPEATPRRPAGCTSEPRPAGSGPGVPSEREAPASAGVPLLVSSVCSPATVAGAACVRPCRSSSPRCRHPAPEPRTPRPVPSEREAPASADSAAEQSRGLRARPIEWRGSEALSRARQGPLRCAARAILRARGSRQEIWRISPNS